MSCGAAGSTDAPPVPVAPSIALSVDSVGASLIAGTTAPPTTIDIAPGSTSALTGLTVTDAGTGTTVSLPWLQVSLSSQTAPAKLSVSFVTSTLAPGSYSATLRVSGANAAAKTIRAGLIVRQRPVLRVSQTTLASTGDVGTALTIAPLSITSSSDEIGGLSVGTPTCDGVPAPWLSTTLSGSSTPASVQLALSTVSLAAGTYNCSFPVGSSQAGVDSASQIVHASATLRAMPKIVLSQDTVEIGGLSGNPPGIAAVVISNGGPGTLAPLSLGTIDYGSSLQGALTASLSPTANAYAITVTANFGMLPVGHFYATIPIVSGATGIANSPKKLVVSVTASAPPPLPSVLVANPASIIVTRQIGTGGSQTFSFSLASTGSTQFAGVNFDLPSSNVPAFMFNPGNSSNPVGIQYMCAGGVGPWQTPCTVLLTVPTSAYLSVGTYQGSWVFKALTGESVAIGLTLKIVP